MGQPLFEMFPIDFFESIQDETKRRRWNDYRKYLNAVYQFNFEKGIPNNYNPLVKITFP